MSGDGTPPEQRPTQTRGDATAPAERVGPYRLLQKLGEGGMGEVWEAEQEEPVRRRVALKLIKAGMDTKQVVARFESERQALALMSHPSIAKVFDAGATEQGRPYFAMEYVKGEPITGYCDKHRLSTKERLELFVQVCDGVQHAHQKGIIHRDLKPSNVLVELSDGKPVPKIIDFGVAKATQQRLTEKTMFTQLGVLVGTPAYVSPEQAEMTGLDVDTRTDVYSLGVMLYELLVGALPFDPKELKAAGYDEIRRTIREEEPSRPSARITTPGEDSTEAAKRRNVDLPTLRRELRGDLDWITMKALAKDRTRRYGSPNELAADIGRHLRHEPVEAGPPSAAYRMGKFVRRHRIGVAAGTVMLLALIAGLAGATYGLVRATRAEAQALQEAATAERVSEFLVGLFEVSDPSQARGNEITAREILDQGAERISRELQDQPVVRARLMATMGRVYLMLGLDDRAESLLQQSLELRREELGDRHPDVAENLDLLAAVSLSRLEYESARTRAEQAVDVLEESLGPDHPRVAEALNLLGTALLGLEEYDQATLRFERVLNINKKTLGPDESGTWTSLRSIAAHGPRFPGARELLERDLAIREEALGPDHPSLVPVMSALAAVLERAGEWGRARSLLERARAVHEKTHGDVPPGVLMTNLVHLGILSVETGNWDEARRLFESCVEQIEELLGADSILAEECHEGLARVEEAEGRYAEARRHYRRAVEVHDNAGGPNTPWFAQVLYNLGTLSRQMGDLEEARSCFERALAIQETFDPESYLTASAMWRLGTILLVQGDPSAAEPLFERSLAIRKKLYGDNIAGYTYNLACFAALHGDRDGAIRHLERAAELGHEKLDQMASDWDLRSLHGDPRFDALLGRSEP